MSIEIIAAIGKNNELGAGNALMWHLPGDMKFFRETTRSSTVIMGRLTFESIGRPLPKRRNIVITRNADYRPEGAEIYPSLEEALRAAEGDERVFIIGGAMVYREALQYADTLILTEIDAEYPKADVFFPVFNKSEWAAEVIAENCDDGVSYRHIKYMRKSTLSNLL